MDFNASFRHLVDFDPSKASSGSYTRVFAAEMVAESTISLPSDSVEGAVGDIQKWLDVYALRIHAQEEVAAWKAEAERSEVKAGEKGEAAWVGYRSEAMAKINPRFVLRQWVLEEIIGQLEEAGVGEDLPAARKKLARVLDVSISLGNQASSTSLSAPPHPILLIRVPGCD